MGLRFSLKNANAVGHLTQGSTITFFNQTFSSDHAFIPNLDFIEKLISYRSLVTTEKFSKQLDPEIEMLRAGWHRFRDEMHRIRDELYHLTPSGGLGPKPDFRNKFVLDYLQSVSLLLSRCKVKSLLLPGFQGSDTDHRLIREDFLNELVEIHPGDSALILQLEDFVAKSETSLLNVFPMFNSALTKLEQWPGITLWNKSDSLFIPIDSISEVFDIFNILKYESENYFDLLRAEFARKLNRKKYAYLFHLSDLHFGNKLANSRKLRVVKILEAKLNELDDCAVSIPIITAI